MTFTARRVFTLTGCEHRGAKGVNERMVCCVEGETGLLAIWGTIGGDRRHIEALEHAVREHGWPVTVECDWIVPDKFEAKKFGHRYWVSQDDYFSISSGR